MEVGRYSLTPGAQKGREGGKTGQGRRRDPTSYLPFDPVRPLRTKSLRQ